jgi:hypothetical protein
VEKLGAEDAGRPFGAAARAFDHRVQVNGRARQIGGRGHQAGLKLAGAASVADDQVAERAGLRAAVIGLEALGPRPIADLVAGGVVCLRRKQAVVDVDDLVPASAAVKAERRAPGRAAEGVLELVAVAPAVGRWDDRVAGEALEAAKAAQRVGDLLGLLGELDLVRHPLPGGAGARLAVVQAAVGDPLGARTQDLDRPRLAVVALRAHDPGPDEVAGERAADEDDVAVDARDAAAALGERVDLEVELGSLAGTGAGCGGRHRLIVAARRA